MVKVIRFRVGHIGINGLNYWGKHKNSPPVPGEKVLKKRGYFIFKKHVEKPKIKQLIGSIQIITLFSFFS